MGGTLQRPHGGTIFCLTVGMHGSSPGVACRLFDKRQAAALFLIAPMIAVSIAPPAPPAITCEMTPSTLRLPDCAAAVIAGSNKVTIWPSTPPPIKPEIMLPIIPRSKVGDDLPTATPPI